MTTIRKAVIPAAGLGTRFLPATKAIPKEMLPIVDTPTIQLVVEEAVAAGITDITIVNGRHKHSIEDHFDHAYELESVLSEKGQDELVAGIRSISTMVRLHSVRQKAPLGLGHAVLAAKGSIGNEAFAVLLGDDLIDNDSDPGIGQLIKSYDKHQQGVVMLMEVPAGQEHLYGIVDGDWQPDGTLRINRMIEKPAPGTAPTRLAIVGRYVLPPTIWSHLENTQPGKGGEIQLTDALLAMAQSQGLIGVRVEGVRHDAGDRVGYLRANIAYALKRPELRDAVLTMLKEYI